MMNQDKILDACFNLLTKTLQFQELFSHPISCQGCEICLQIHSTLQNLQASSPQPQDPVSLLSSFFHINKSNLSESLSSRFYYQSKCQCGSKFSLAKQNLFEVSIPPLSTPTCFSSLIKSSIKALPPNTCINSTCQIKKSGSKLKLDLKSKNFLFALKWKSEDLQSLVNFVLGLRDYLEFGELFGNNLRVYLEGMILSNGKTSIYVKMNPCIIYADLQRNTEIYIDYFLFAIIQYSMFPKVLVYNCAESGIGLEDKIFRYKENILSYLRFLDGDLVLQKEICFYCWYADHRRCSEVDGQVFWTCVCKRINPVYCLFCVNCAEPIQKIFEGSDKMCFFCGGITNSHYCRECSFVSGCSDCTRCIYKTQPLACSSCNNLINFQTSKTCATCNQSPVKYRCINCHLAKKSQTCIHASDHNCDECLFDYTCGVCFKPQKVFQGKCCWACQEMLIENMCLKCKIFPSSNSFVCEFCIKSSKKCDKNHIITVQSTELCAKCKEKSEFFCKKCPKLVDDCKKSEINCNNRVICTECGSDSEGVANFSIENQMCRLCLSRAKVCPCGGVLKSGQKKCASCGKNTAGFNEIAVFYGNGEGCRACDFPIEPSVIFCENCNLSHEGFGKKKKCKICKKACAGLYCESCYKQGNCSTCNKDMLVSQRFYCLKCKSQVFNRVCGTCKVIVPLSDLQCFVCAQSNWNCVYSHSNPSRSSRCYLCAIPNSFCCDWCKKLSVMPLDSFRCPLNQVHPPLQNDFKCCQSCSLSLKSCSCGFKYFPFESVCKICSNVIPK